MTIYDRESESVWLQVGGRAVKGPLVGTVLKTGPLLDTTWGNWKKLHPDTLVMSPDTPYARYYAPKGVHTPRGMAYFPAPYFKTTLTRTDKRLPPAELVLAVALPQPSASGKPGEMGEPLTRAYPVKALKESPGVVNDTLGSAPVAVFFDPDTTTAAAVSRILDGKTLTFEVRKQADGKPAFYDKETGTRWNIEGKGEEGPLAGKSLERLDSHMSEWYGWVAYFPTTTIYGRTDPPQTLDLLIAPAPATPGTPPAEPKGN